MRGDNLTPHNAVTRLGAGRRLLLRRCLIHIRYPFSDVERRLAPRVDALDLQPRLLHMLIFQVALVADVDGFDIKSSLLSAHDAVSRGTRRRAPSACKA